MKRQRGRPGRISHPTASALCTLRISAGQWHQLWVMPSEGGDPFPISYGDFDNTNPRWSPDGKRIAFISNRGGNTSLWVQEVLGGASAQWLPKRSAI